MHQLMRRLDQLEESIPSADSGRLILVSWVAEKGAAPSHAQRGDEVLERTKGEEPEAFIARVNRTFRPATGIRSAFLYHDTAAGPTKT